MIRQYRDGAGGRHLTPADPNFSTTAAKNRYGGEKESQPVRAGLLVSS